MVGGIISGEGLREKILVAKDAKEILRKERKDFF